MAILRPVLVTGATGFLGQRLAAALVRRGEAVRLLHRTGRRKALADILAAAAPGLARAVEGDALDPESIRRAVDGCRAVVHLAARVSRGGCREDFRRVNVDGLAAVLEASAEQGVERILYTSSFLALGPSDVGPGRPGPPAGRDESALSPATPDLDHYQASKHEAALLARAAAAGGAPLVTLYPGVVVGPGPLGESNHVTNLMLRHLGGHLVPLPEGGHRRWCFVHADDVVAGHLAAFDRAPLGTAYVLGGENASLAQLFSVVETLTGRRPPRASVPHAIAWSVGLVEEVLERVTGRAPRQLTRGVARVLRREWAFSSARAERDLGWRARSLRATVEDTLRWLEAAGHVPRGTVRPAAGLA